MVVASGSIASLKVTTTGALGETPVASMAGTVETIVGAAVAAHATAKGIKVSSTRRDKTFPKERK
jgi:hypothetical protein